MAKLWSSLSKYVLDYKKSIVLNPKKDIQKSLIQLADRHENIKIIIKGAWDKTCVLKFNASDRANGSFIMNSAGFIEEKEVEVVAVDDIINDSVSYIKIDIKGAAIRALKGMNRIIKENNPKMAVCIYHHQYDLSEIWKYLFELHPTYDFYVRHHNKKDANETVLYVV